MVKWLIIEGVFALAIIGPLIETVVRQHALLKIWERRYNRQVDSQERFFDYAMKIRRDREKAISKNRSLGGACDSRENLEGKSH